MKKTKGIRNAFAEHQMLKLLGPFWETEITYDPDANMIIANNRAVGTSQRIKPPFVLLGNLRETVTMTEMKKWIEERIEALCGNEEETSDNKE